MRIKFYHMWVYRLFFKVWNPIFRERPDIHKAFVDHGSNYIKIREQQVIEARDSFEIVK